MQKNNRHHVSVMVSIGIGVIIALGYHFWRFGASKTSIISSLVLLFAAWLYLAYTAGKIQGVLTYLAIWSVGCAIEWIGIATCRPYGCFQYSDLLWPRFFGTFPYLLVWVWPFIIVSIAHLIPSKYSGRSYVGVWTLLLLFLDLALDPVHIWQWIRSYNQQGVHRFGVPVQNFLWRIITWWISMWIYQKRKTTIHATAWYYAWIVIFIMFWTQFLLWLRQYN